MKTLGWTLAVLLGCALWAVADEEGHHHEELTEKQLGTVHFPVSCAAAEQKPFARGVALLHSFWYEEAEKEFADIAQDDPKCAMAQWGLAMSQWHQLWNHPDAAVTKKGLEEAKKGGKLHAVTPRERDYIAAMKAFYGGKGDFFARARAYSKAMEKVYERYPDDHEGAAFYALSILAANEGNDPTFANDKKAAAILEKLFAIEPDHPGVAHYLIHAYDKPQLAQLGLPAARRYAKIAPASPHALHMPSHIFARLGMWQDDINSNLASIAATRKSAAMHMGGEGHEFHAMDFLEYAYLQCGREADARHLIEEVKAMPPMKDMYGLGFDPRVWALVNFPARYVVELHRWNDAAALEAVPEAETDDSAATYWARGIGHARSGHPDQTRQDLAALDSIYRNLVREKKPMAAEFVQQDRQEVAAWLAHAEGRNDEATNSLRQIAEKEEREGDEPLAIPAREMLADLLVELNRPQEALTEYEADLKYNPNRFDGLAGAANAAELTGKKEEANSYSAQLVKICVGSSSDRPELLHAKQLLAYGAVAQR